MDWGTLAAVALGGLVSILSTLWADSRRWRREDAVRWKGEQKEIYASYLNSAWGCASSMRRVMAWGRRTGAGGQSLISAVTIAQTSLEQSLGLMNMFAPDDTLTAAEDLFIFCTGSVGEATKWVADREDLEDVDWTGYNQEEARLRHQLMVLVKRDLGITDRTTRRPLVERLR